MWEIWEHSTMRRQLGKLPLTVRQRYEIWKDVAAHSGQDGLRVIRGFHDTRLHGEWHGWRSARLSDDHRVIYRYIYKKFWPIFVLRM